MGISPPFASRSATQKPRRIVDKALMKSARGQRCEVCGGRWGVVRHHVKTRGSGGPDSEQNTVLLDIPCHDKAHRGIITKKQLRKIIRDREWLRKSNLVAVHPDEHAERHGKPAKLMALVRKRGIRL